MRSTNPAIPQSYSSRTLRKQIAIPAPSVDPLALRSGLGSELRRAREAEGGVMVSPYGKRRTRERSEQREHRDREESVQREREESVARSRGCEFGCCISGDLADWRTAPTPMRESSGKPSPSPAPQEYVHSFPFRNGTLTPLPQTPGPFNVPRTTC